MSFISVFRLAALSISLFLGLVVLGLTAHWIQITIALASVGDLVQGVEDFEIVAVVAGVLTLLSLPTMLVVGLIRRGAFTSMVAVELPVLTVLWVLFLTAGALTAQWKDLLYPFGCSDPTLSPAGHGFCREFFAIIGCSFVAWIALFLYTITLLIFALIGQSRGNTVWTASVAEANFLETRANNEFLQPVGVPVYIPAVATYTPATPQQYPMTQQYTGSTPGHSGLAQV